MTDFNNPGLTNDMAEKMIRNMKAKGLRAQTPRRADYRSLDYSTKESRLEALGLVINNNVMNTYQIPNMRAHLVKIQMLQAYCRIFINDLVSLAIVPPNYNLRMPENQSEVIPLNSVQDDIQLMKALLSHYLTPEKAKIILSEIDPSLHSPFIFVNDTLNLKVDSEIEKGDFGVSLKDNQPSHEVQTFYSSESKPLLFSDWPAEDSVLKAAQAAYLYLFLDDLIRFLSETRKPGQSLFRFTTETLSVALVQSILRIHGNKINLMLMLEMSGVDIHSLDREGLKAEFEKQQAKAAESKVVNK